MRNVVKCVFAFCFSFVFSLADLSINRSGQHRMYPVKYELNLILIINLSIHHSLSSYYYHPLIVVITAPCFPAISVRNFPFSPFPTPLPRYLQRNHPVHFSLNFAIFFSSCVFLSDINGPTTVDYPSPVLVLWFT